VSTAPTATAKAGCSTPRLAPSQEDIERLVERASKRSLRFLERRGVITLVIAPGDGEVTVVTDESMGERAASACAATYCALH
jgi:dihydrodipicolinate synthase/N-acetylneuraminate lyase